MKISMFIILVDLSAFPAAGSAQQPDTTGAAVLFYKAMSQINPRHVDWVKGSAATVNEKNMAERDVKKMASEYAVLGPMNRGDSEALTFLVLMQAAKNANEDLKASMSKIKSINEQKQEIKQALAKLNEKNRSISGAELDSFKLLLNTRFPVQAVRTVKPDTVKTGKVIMTDAKVSKAEIDNIKNWMKQKLDSLNEMGEMESLRLQMTMERMSRMMSTLSNLLKKINDTQNSIIQNLK